MKITKVEAKEALARIHDSTHARGYEHYEALIDMMPVEQPEKEDIQELLTHILESYEYANINDVMIILAVFDYCPDILFDKSFGWKYGSKEDVGYISPHETIQFFLQWITK